MWVVKLGGSLAYDRSLPAWLDLLATPRGASIVIVPGGGPFADRVRDAQAHWAFDDDAAHAMALLAMAQFGWLMHALEPTLRIEPSIDALRRRRADEGACIWVPLDLLTDQRAVERTWNVTSDSMAAWLARTLQAERLLLVKSCAVPATPNVDNLAAAGIVDRAFPGHVAGAGFGLDLLDAHDVARLRGLLEDADALGR